MGIHLLLIGKTGTGKSSTGTSILLGSSSFKADDKTDSVTSEIRSEYTVFKGRTLKVTDGPGLGDTTMSDDDALKMVRDGIKKALDTDNKGFNVFLLVVRFNCRFTEEDIQTVRMLKEMFGQDFVKNHCILLMTCGDNFEKEDDLGTFDDWCVKQTGVFGELVKECENRTLLFDNRTKDEDKKMEQMDRLIRMTDALVYTKHCYTKEHFEEAHRRRLIEIDCKLTHHSHMEALNDLKQKFAQIKKYHWENQIQPFKCLKQEADKLYEEVFSLGNDLEAQSNVLIILDILSKLTTEIMDSQINARLHVLKENKTMKAIKQN